MAAKKSFSMRVKEEAAEQISSRRHCQNAELAAMISLCGTDIEKNGIKIQSENVCVIKKCFTLLKKTFNIYSAITVRSGKGGAKHHLYILRVQGEPYVRELLEAIKHPAAQGRDPEEPVDDLILQKNCCKRAFVRGCFLAAGSVTDPAKSYHLEIVCPTEEKAKQLCACINSFWQQEEGMEAKIIARSKSGGRHSFVVYLKEGNQISDLLNICETYRCLMEMENIRVEKEIANSLNRKLNCEMANMVKTISAAQEQKNDILYIEEHIGLERLPAELEQLARIRLEDTEISLKELGEKLTPPIGKSGVNHRLRKIRKIADELRNGKQYP